MADQLQGGAKGVEGGAQVGTAISPGLGTIIGAGVGAAAGLLGGGEEESTRFKPAHKSPTHRLAWDTYLTLLYGTTAQEGLADDELVQYIIDNMGGYKEEDWDEVEMYLNMSSEDAKKKEANKEWAKGEYKKWKKINKVAAPVREIKGEDSYFEFLEKATQAPLDVIETAKEGYTDIESMRKSMYEKDKARQESLAAKREDIYDKSAADYAEMKGYIQKPENLAITFGGAPMGTAQLHGKSYQDQMSRALEGERGINQDYLTGLGADYANIAGLGQNYLAGQIGDIGRRIDLSGKEFDIRTLPESLKFSEFSDLAQKQDAQRYSIPSSTTSSPVSVADIMAAAGAGAKIGTTLFPAIPEERVPGSPFIYGQ
jgi:hypothetical protein